MLDCNVTANFIKEKERMCDSHEYCMNCPLDNDGFGCTSFMEKNPEKAIAIVQKWSNENPVRTIMMDFFEKFPNAPKDDDGTPETCPWHLGYDKRFNCTHDCVKCWNRPLVTIDKAK